MSAASNFSHVPRPPVVPESHPSQRYFCAPTGLHLYEGVRGSDDPLKGEVGGYRAAESKNARLRVSLGHAGNMSVQLTAAELIEVARICLDMAHDLETLSVAILKAQLLAEVTP